MQIRGWERALRWRDQWSTLASWEVRKPDTVCLTRVYMKDTAPPVKWSYPKWVNQKKKIQAWMHLSFTGKRQTGKQVNHHHEEANRQIQRGNILKSKLSFCKELPGERKKEKESELLQIKWDLGKATTKLLSGSCLGPDLIKPTINWPLVATGRNLTMKEISHGNKKW